MEKFIVDVFSKIKISFGCLVKITKFSPANIADLADLAD